MLSKTEILPGIIQLAQAYRGILLDAYGVFWNGNALGVIPQAAEAMAALVAQGKIVGILSNSTHLASYEAAKFYQHGLKPSQHFHFLMTSGEITRALFLNKKAPFPTPHQKFWVFGNDHPKFFAHQAIFEQTTYQETFHLEEADFIYISIPHLKGQDQVDPSLFYEQVKKLVPYHLPMLCANPDYFAHEGSPLRAVVRQGSIAKIYEELGGEVFYIGKPYLPAYQAALQHFQSYDLYDPSEILMVGDTPETDIRGANKAGLASALIVQEGIMGGRINQLSLTALLDDLPLTDFPTYFIERLSNEFHSPS